MATLNTALGVASEVACCVVIAHVGWSSRVPFTDALRFTLCQMTTHTQDIRLPVEKDPRTGRNTSPKFDQGRNFCNKLWNAARFAFANLASAPYEQLEIRTLPTEDRWILARLRHETFFSLAALNARIRELLIELNARPMKGYGGASRREYVSCPMIRCSVCQPTGR